MNSCKHICSGVFIYGLVFVLIRKVEEVQRLEEFLINLWA